jgi:hypothetical protein
MRIGLTARELAQNYAIWCWGKDIPIDVDKIEKFFMQWLEQFKPVAVITIPRYMREYKAADSIMVKYYEKGVGKKLPHQYCDKVRFKMERIREPDNINYFWKDFPVVRQKVKKMVDFLVDKNGVRVIANTDQVGKARVNNINGQAIYNGFISKQQRNKMMNSIKDQFRQFAMTCPQLNKYPLLMEVEVHDVPVDKVFSNGQDWDLGNRIFPYNKAFEDVLKGSDCNIIEDDSIWYITGPAAPLFVPIEKTEDRKLVYKFYLDRRKVVLDNPFYQDRLKDQLK